MATVVAHRTVTPIGRDSPRRAKPWRRSLTLADLITAVQDVVGPADDALVVATVRHLLRSGWVTGRGTGTQVRRGPPLSRRRT
jgi:hypothetical protein